MEHVPLSRWWSVECQHPSRPSLGGSPEQCVDATHNSNHSADVESLCKCISSTIGLGGECGWGVGGECGWGMKKGRDVGKGGEGGRGGEGRVGEKGEEEGRE